MEDADEFFVLNSDKEVMRFIRPPKTRSECDSFLQQNIAFYLTHPNLGRWAANEKGTGTFIGSLALIPIKEEDDRIQIGYALKPSSWGNGFATELVKAGIPFFFNSQEHQYLYGITEQPNIISQKVLLKCGFKQDGFFMENKKKLLMFKLERHILEQPNIKNQITRTKSQEPNKL